MRNFQNSNQSDKSICGKKPLFSKDALHLTKTWASQRTSMNRLHKIPLRWLQRASPKHEWKAQNEEPKAAPHSLTFLFWMSPPISVLYNLEKHNFPPQEGSTLLILVYNQERPLVLSTVYNKASLLGTDLLIFSFPRDGSDLILGQGIHVNSQLFIWKVGRWTYLINLQDIKYGSDEELGKKETFECKNWDWKSMWI